MIIEHFANPNLRMVVAKCLFFQGCGVRQNLYMFRLYLNPDQDDRIFYCLLASMAAVQPEDIRASFLFVGELNGHRQKWKGSTTTNCHGVADFEFATVSSCDQLVMGPTHSRGGTLVPLMTDVPDLVQVVTGEVDACFMAVGRYIVTYPNEPYVTLY